MGFQRTAVDIWGRVSRQFRRRLGFFFFGGGGEGGHMTWCYLNRLCRALRFRVWGLGFRVPGLGFAMIFA